MEELRALADRLDSGHDLEAYCDVLAFGMHGPGGGDSKDAHRLLRKPLLALGAAREWLAERHVDAYRGGVSREELLLIGTAALLDSTSVAVGLGSSGSHGRRCGRKSARQPWTHKS
ncbi:hypothetical protein ACFXKR_25910 [Streptomyces violascens]|uniref:hypothetical protein n=1 Tax=Streptomyces violascens TaxID=67381 RepID=UPI00368C9A6B